MILLRMKSVRLIIDGVDEWDLGTVRKLLADLTRLTSAEYCSSTHACHKLLVSSRDIPQISRVLLKKPTLSLSDEKSTVSAAIRMYAHAAIMDLNDQLCNNVEVSLLEAIEDKLVEKSDGTFAAARAQQ